MMSLRKDIGYDKVRIGMKWVNNAEIYYFQIGKRISSSGKDYYLEDFKYFISAFPDSEWADDAQYRIGFFYERQEKYSKALEGGVRFIDIGNT
jgi:TolA-binding protein